MKYITLAISLLICINAEAQVIRAEPFYVSPEEAVSGNLLLDDYPGAAAAYSLRKLDKDYTGSAIRVRRSSDNTEQDIGFVNNYLDTASMKTFVGNNNGFVVTWYNQADSAGVFGVRNATNTTAANQPQIIAGGVINYVGSTPSVRFIKANKYYLAVTNSKGTFNFIHDGTESAITYVGNSTDLANNTFFYGNNGDQSGNIGIGHRNTTTSQSRIDIGNGTTQVAFITTGAIDSLTKIIHLNIDTDNPTSTNRLNQFINGGNAITSGGTATPSASNSLYDFQIGATGLVTSTLMHQGGIKELLIYGSNQSANRTAIRDNINSFYSIY